MFKPQKLFMAAIATCALVSCKSGFNKIYEETSKETEKTCNPAPADSSTSAATKKVLKLIATFSCEESSKNNRVIAGQHLGTAEDIQGSTSSNAYHLLLQTFVNNKTTPGIVSAEYGLADYTDAELKTANATLEEHAKNGGIVMVSWMPSNPWLDSFNTGHSTNVDLNLLNTGVDSNEAVKKWRAEIDHIIVALKDLDSRNVTVLFRPLPAMNSTAYWWGSTYRSSNTDTEGSDFKTLWKNLFNRVNDAGLNNVLWVFSPMDSSGNSEDVQWGFNSSYVDIVAGIARNDNLNVNDYANYQDMDKPLGMSELSPVYASNNGTLNGTFDTTQYRSKLTGTYSDIAFWISWNDVVINNVANKLSLIANKNASTLLKDEKVYTKEKIDKENWLD